MVPRTWFTTLVVAALTATACSAGSGSSSPTSTTAPSPGTGTGTPTAAADGRPCTPVEELPGGDVEEAPATDSTTFPWDQPDPAVLEDFDPDEIIRGGPPPDGIRPIDDPCFDDVPTADQWLEPQSPVMVVEVDGDRRAYPLAIFTQHEIVNDVVGGVPVVVTYCPLCNSGLAFLRTVDGQVLDFGTSGRLYRSNLVMYDRQTLTLWSQFLGQAVVGDPEFVGTKLERLSTSLLDWEEFHEATPDGLVLSRDSIPGRVYGQNPYVGYEGTNDPFLFDGPTDDRLAKGTRVVGIGAEVDPVAVPLPDLREQRVIDVELDGQRVTIWWQPGQASALDTSDIDQGTDVGSTGVFVPVLPDGTELTFAPDGDDGFIDEQTGSRWNLLGEAIEGELAGERLEEVPRDDTFWFVWFAFQPDTRLAPGPSG